MLYYYRNDLGEIIDPGKTNDSEECMICRYWYFNHGFKYQDSVCNGCHDWLMPVLMLVIMLLFLLKKFIIVVLFTALANLKQFLC